MASLEERVRALEEHAQLMSDHVALYQLMMSYGPAVDSRSSESAGALWTDDGIYDWDSHEAPFVGRDGVAAMVDGRPHQSITGQGSAHVIGMPWLRIMGDTAVATCYAGLYRWDGDEFRVWRMTANRWEFARTPQGWRVTARTNRRLDGSDEARAVLRRAVEESSTSSTPRPTTEGNET